MRVLKGLVLLALPAMLAGCLTTTTHTAVTDTSCHAFEPIRYSRLDTEETQRQARGHNAAWDALCEPLK